MNPAFAELHGKFWPLLARTTSVVFGGFQGQSPPSKAVAALRAWVLVDMISLSKDTVPPAFQAADGATVHRCGGSGPDVTGGGGGSGDGGGGSENSDSKDKATDNSRGSGGSGQSVDSGDGSALTDCFGAGGHQTTAEDGIETVDEGGNESHCQCCPGPGSGPGSGGHQSDQSHQKFEPCPDYVEMKDKGDNQPRGPAMKPTNGGLSLHQSHQSHQSTLQRCYTAGGWSFSQMSQDVIEPMTEGTSP